MDSPILVFFISLSLKCLANMCLRAHISKILLRKPLTLLFSIRISYGLKNLLFFFSFILYNHFLKYFRSNYLRYFNLYSIKKIIFLDFLITHNNHHLLFSFILIICKKKNKKLNAKLIALM